MIYETNKQLQAACEVWQKRLRLLDWIVQAKIVRQRDLKEGCQAHVSWVLEKKMASIRIMDPIDYAPDSMVPQDMEQSLVHELLHLHFAPIDDEVGTPKELAIEQAIDCIADALTRQYREEEQHDNV